MSTCGIVGAGEMGALIARNLAEAGWEVSIYDKAPDRSAALAPSGVAAVGSLAELAAAARAVVITVGPGSEAQRLFADGADSLLAGAEPGDLFCVSSTITPEHVLGIAKACEPVGATVVDLPLVGGGYSLARREAVTFAGGAADDVRRAAELFEVFCKEIIPVGPAGAGQVAKLANNMLLWGSIAVTVEGMDLASRYGVAPEALRTALMAGSGRTWALETWDRPRAMPWCEEDMAIADDCSTRHDVSFLASRGVREAVRRVRALKRADGYEEDSLQEWLAARRGALPPTD